MWAIVRWGSRRLLSRRSPGGAARRRERRRRIAAIAVYLVATVLGGGQALRVLFFGARAEWIQAGAALIVATAAFGLAASIGTHLGMPPRSFGRWLARGERRGDDRHSSPRAR